MKTILFCLAALCSISVFCQPRAEGLHDSLNGRIKVMSVTFFKISKDKKGNYVSTRDYFSHHQDFVYNENNILVRRVFFRDKKNIDEDRDMIKFKQLPEGVRYDTAYSTTDTTDDMLITRYKNGVVSEYVHHQTVKGGKRKYLIYLNADKKLTFFKEYDRKEDGMECFVWQEYADSPLNLKNPPGRWEKYNDKGHLILTVYNMSGGVKKSQGRTYKYDKMNNPVWIQFTEWNPATNKFEPTSEEFYEYKYGK